MSGPRQPGLLSPRCLFAGCHFCHILHKHDPADGFRSPIRWINYACAAKHSIRLIQLVIPQRWKVFVRSSILEGEIRHLEDEIKHLEGEINCLEGEITDAGQIFLLLFFL